MLAVRFKSYLKLLVDKDLFKHPLGVIVQSTCTTFKTVLLPLVIIKFWLLTP